MKKTFTEEQVLAFLAKACEKAGGLRAWARANGVTDSYVSLVLNGGAHPGEKITKALGLTKSAIWTLDT